jgi:hypothetical protein
LHKQVVASVFDFHLVLREANVRKRQKAQTDYEDLLLHNRSPDFGVSFFWIIGLVDHWILGLLVALRKVAQAFLLARTCKLEVCAKGSFHQHKLALRGEFDPQASRLASPTRACSVRQKLRRSAMFIYSFRFICIVSLRAFLSEAIP